MKFETKKIKSFDRSFSTITQYKKPDKYKDIENFSKSSEKIISSGSNYSYSPAGFSSRSLSLELKNFNRILNFDIKKKEITVEAGMVISEFLNYILPKNFWIPQLPGYPYISLGGSIASNVHGKSCGVHGTIRNSIKDILIFHKKNGWLRLSEESNKEIFDLTIGGLGLTGTIVNITFKLSEYKNNNFITTRYKVENTHDCINFIKKNSSSNAFIYSWNRADDIKKIGEGFVFKNEINNNSKKKENNISNKKKKNSFLLPFPLWNKLSLKIVNNIYQKFISYKKKETNESFEQVIFPFVGKEFYFDFYGKKGFIESQLLVGEKEFNSFFEEFKYLYELHEPLITLFSIKNMSGEQKYLRFEDNKICITFDFVNNKKNLNFLNEIDKICIKYKVLPSIIKDSRISKQTFFNCYDQAQEFIDKLNNFDKERIYVSELSDRLGI